MSPSRQAVRIQRWRRPLAEPAVVARRIVGRAPHRANVLTTYAVVHDAPGLDPGEPTPVLVEEFVTPLAAVVRADPLRHLSGCRVERWDDWPHGNGPRGQEVLLELEPPPQGGPGSNGPTP